MRMQMRRFARLTNAFSKKFENHLRMIALYTVCTTTRSSTGILKASRPRWALASAMSFGQMTDLAEFVDAAQSKAG
jgi:hypothetical protein